MPSLQRTTVDSGNLCAGSRVNAPYVATLENDPMRKRTLAVLIIAGLGVMAVALLLSRLQIDSDEEE